MMLKSVGGVLCATAILAAAPLATFECQEITGRDWARTLVTYPLELEAGQARPGAVRLTDGQGLEVPCQLSRLTTHVDGSIATARISFYAALPKGGGYRFELTDGKPAAGKPPRTTVDGSWLTLDNGPVVIRLPAGKKQFAKPLAMVGDRAAAMKNLDRMEQAGLAFGPIAGVRLADGRWVGGSYFAAEAIKVVRYRQKSRETQPDDATPRAALEKAPKATGYEILAGKTLEAPAAKVTLSFALDEQGAPMEQLAPGVRKQTLAHGVAFDFNTPEPVRFAQGPVVFVGRRGGIQVDTSRKTVRLVLLDGQKIGYGQLQADVGTGPYDLTFHHDQVVGVSEGPGRFIHVTLPEGIVQLAALTIGGISYAPGTYGQIAIVPVLDGRCEFTLENLPQPPVFRSWQLW